MTADQTSREVLLPREVILGRTTHVRRTLPNLQRRLIGAWCFLDHYGPDDIKQVGGMWVPPHPHTGLQTVTWLFEGLGRHTDSLGFEQLIEPGQLNVMTSGRGICHAEVSPDDAPPYLHGVQLWVALPDEVRDRTPAAFHHLPELPTLVEPGVTMTVFMGTFAGLESPAPAFTPLAGAELKLEPGAQVVLPLDPGFEYGVLAVDQSLTVDGTSVERHQLLYRDVGGESMTLSAPEGGIALILGGEPFLEELVMWWNFVGRTHEEIVQARADWNEGGFAGRPERFGTVEDFPENRLLAPALPNVQLKPRGRQR